MPEDRSDKFSWSSGDFSFVKPEVVKHRSFSPSFTLGQKRFRIAPLRVKTVASLRQMVQNFKDSKKTVPVVYNFDDDGQRQPTLLPPIGLGHEKDSKTIFLPSDMPNVGEVANLALRGNVMFGDFIRVPRKVCELVNDGKYNKVSIELWPWPPGKFVGQGWMLKRVALLGADVPAVYSLDTIPMADEGTGIIRGVELFEVGTHNDKTYTLDDLKDIVQNYWLNRPSNAEISAILRRYLKRDAKRPLSDGAEAAKEHKDTNESVFVFRDLPKSLPVVY